ncbi:HlyD family efflux transporter periplasmic adaptor subunit [Spongiactinospora sp. TRM90649]|uniref:HlyD family efflux transporter periplasmic adaptor subunit n=1 Tax=Spongiactinospora sp. TRM90649 TaxID=3031114 RepID=UPI0023FA1E5A|nr:HlyD family efflux transporter periplasmic adaptor subunit [Spongiactinospora sp. TRM90649]MDF5757701.1 HlyD family efflux transporter periplasmic adaptor subunit [Spongiactinospora sp. TRM90649]
MIQFRGEAVAAAQASDVLDQPVRLTGPRTWLVLAAVAAVALVGVLWAFAGSVQMPVEARGLLTVPRGSFPIQAISGGQISDVFVRPGDAVRPGGRIAAVRDGGSTTEVTAPTRGQVFAVPIRHGQVVRRGETLAVAEYAGAPDDRLVAVLFVPVAQAAAVRGGQRVDLTMEPPAGSYGMLRGRVTDVDPTMWTKDDIAAFVGDDDLAGLAGPGGPVQRVMVELPRSATAESRLRSRTAVTGAIHQPARRPIDWILP